MYASWQTYRAHTSTLSTGVAWADTSVTYFRCGMPACDVHAPPAPSPADVHAWLKRQYVLLEHERGEERSQNALLLSECAPRVLARHGLALLGLSVANAHTGEGGKVLVELQNSTAVHQNQDLAQHTFRPGDVCVIERHDAKKNVKEKNEFALRGVVYRANENAITIALDEQSASQEEDGGFPPLVRIVKLSNEATYDRLVKTVDAVAKVVGVPPVASQETPTEFMATAPKVVCSLLGLHVPTWSKDAPSWTPIHSGLNDTQRAAISHALRAEQLALIHGPPGTGKTTAVTELIIQLVTLYPQARVLVCGASNLAVDNLLERVLAPEYKDALVAADAHVTRLGHPARVLPALAGATLDAQSRQSSEGQLVRDVAHEIDELMQVLSPNSGSARAGNKSARKAPRVKGEERRRMWEQVRELRKEFRKRDRALATTVLNKARIVMSTCHGAGARQLDGIPFEFCIIDEACQALDMSCWTPILRLVPHGRVFLSGDHLQLPPTVMADAPRAPPTKSLSLPPSQSLQVTMFDRILSMYGDACKAFLSVQYRMNDEIMAFPNEQLYNGKLMAHESCARIRLTDIGVDGDEENDIQCAPLVLYDTTGLGMYEREDEAVLSTHSRVNENEAALVLRHVELLNGHGVPPESIAVLSPYSAQVHLLSQQIRSVYGMQIEVGTVDGMQGREKDVVIVSLVRSNDGQEVGFLHDSRRLNVAMTRAKRQLVIVGDTETIGGENARDDSISRSFLRAWVEHLHSHALVEVAT